MVIRFFVVRVAINQVVLRKFQDDGNQDEEFTNDLLPEIAVELCDLLIVLLDDAVFSDIFVCRYRLGDIELAYCQR